MRLLRMHFKGNYQFEYQTDKNLFLKNSLPDKTSTYFSTTFTEFTKIGILSQMAHLVTLIFEEFIHGFCWRLLFADLHIQNDHTDYLNFKVCLHFSTKGRYVV